MLLSATLTIEVSMIAMISPSIVVAVTRMTGTPPVELYRGRPAPGRRRAGLPGTR